MDANSISQHRNVPRPVFLHTHEAKDIVIISYSPLHSPHTMMASPGVKSLASNRNEKHLLKPVNTKSKQHKLIQSTRIMGDEMCFTPTGSATYGPHTIRRPRTAPYVWKDKSSRNIKKNNIDYSIRNSPNRPATALLENLEQLSSAARAHYDGKEVLEMQGRTLQKKINSIHAQSVKALPPLVMLSQNNYPLSESMNRCNDNFPLKRTTNADTILQTPEQKLNLSSLIEVNNVALQELNSSLWELHDVAQIEQWLSGLAEQYVFAETQEEENVRNSVAADNELAASTSTQTSSLHHALDIIGLGRTILRSAGLSDDLISRLYVALFSYSVGCLDTLNQVCRHARSRCFIMKSIWKAYLQLIDNDPGGSDSYNHALESSRAINKLIYEERQNIYDARVNSILEANHQLDTLIERALRSAENLRQELDTQHRLSKTLETTLNSMQLAYNELQHDLKHELAVKHALQVQQSELEQLMQNIQQQRDLFRRKHDDSLLIISKISNSIMIFNSKTKELKKSHAEMNTDMDAFRRDVVDAEKSFTATKGKLSVILENLSRQKNVYITELSVVEGLQNELDVEIQHISKIKKDSFVSVFNADNHKYMNNIMVSSAFVDFQSYYTTSELLDLGILEHFTEARSEFNMIKSEHHALSMSAYEIQASIEEVYVAQSQELAALDALRDDISKTNVRFEQLLDQHAVNTNSLQDLQHRVRKDLSPLIMATVSANQDRYTHLTYLQQQKSAAEDLQQKLTLDANALRIGTNEQRAEIERIKALIESDHKHLIDVRCKKQSLTELLEEFSEQLKQIRLQTDIEVNCFEKHKHQMMQNYAVEQQTIANIEHQVQQLATRIESREQEIIILEQDLSTTELALSASHSSLDIAIEAADSSSQRIASAREHLEIVSVQFADIQIAATKAIEERSQELSLLNESYVSVKARIERLKKDSLQLEDSVAALELRLSREKSSFTQGIENLTLQLQQMNEKCLAAANEYKQLTQTCQNEVDDFRCQYHDECQLADYISALYVTRDAELQTALVSQKESISRHMLLVQEMKSATEILRASQIELLSAEQRLADVKQQKLEEQLPMDSINRDIENERLLQRELLADLLIFEEYNWFRLAATYTRSCQAYSHEIDQLADDLIYAASESTDCAY